jgi:hypothetical protein
MRSHNNISVYFGFLNILINRLQSGQIRTNYYTVLWCHTLRAAPSPETMYGLVHYGLSPIGPVHIPQTIYGLK